MNTQNKTQKWVKRMTGLVTAIMLTVITTGQASARILFEDDTYFNIQSEGIILDFNDNIQGGTASTASSEGATYTALTPGTAGDNIDVVIVNGANCDITTPGSCTTVVGDVITITVDLVDANGNDVNDDPVTSAMIVAEINAYAPAAALVTASSGDATSVTASTTNLASGVDGDNIEFQLGNDGSDALISYSDDTQDVTLSTPGGDFNFSDDNLSTTGAILFGNSSEFHIREVTDEATASCTTIDEIVLDTTESRIYVCTATGTPGTWTATDAGGAQDFEGVYGIDADDTLTASGTFDIDAVGAVGIDSDAAVTIGAAGIGLTSDGGILSLTGDGTADIDINNAGGAIDLDATTFDLLTTGAFSIDGIGNSNVSTDTGNLSLSTTTSGDVDITGATNVDLVSTAGDITLSAGDDVIFDDAQLVGVVQLTDTATDWNATFGSDGIIDNINEFTSTANGDGASNVGIEDASAWFTGAEIEAALNEMEALFGSTTSSTFNFTEDNVLTDNDAVYTALNKLDLKWGDLSSTANGEGASLVGIEDAAGDFTATTVEGALTELAADIGNNYADLTFYPEFPDSVVNADGTSNKGTLESFYDGTEESSYYNWTSKSATTQDIDIHFAFPLPTDFAATGDFTFNYRTGTVTEADNDVEVRLYNVTDATECANDLTNGTAGVWATGTITTASINAGCTGGSALDAGDIVEVRIKVLDNTGAADFADIGFVKWLYTK